MVPDVDLRALSAGSREFLTKVGEIFSDLDAAFPRKTPAPREDFFGQLSAAIEKVFSPGPRARLSNGERKAFVFYLTVTYFAACGAKSHPGSAAYLPSLNAEPELRRLVERLIPDPMPELLAIDTSQGAEWNSIPTYPAGPVAGDPGRAGPAPFDPSDPMAAEIVSLLRAESDAPDPSENKENHHARSSRLRLL